MQRKLIEKINFELPGELAEFVEGARLYDSSCSPEARVWFIDKDSGYYLKTCGAGTLKREAEMDAYFHKKGLGVEVLQYISLDRDWLLTEKAEGEDCTHKQYLDNPERLCDTKQRLAEIGLPRHNTLNRSKDLLYVGIFQ